MMTTQAQVRTAFWQTHKDTPGVTKRKIPNYSGNGKMHNTDTRCAFADFVDYLSKSGQITEALASKVTL